MSSPDAAEASTVTVRYWAAARDAAGRAHEELAAVTLADLIDQLSRRHGPVLGRLLTICSYLIDGAPAKREHAARVSLTPGVVVEVLPPFAGG